MSTKRAAIVRTGIANTASVQAAFDRLGISSEVIERPEAMQRFDCVVLPGVGAFGHAMARLEQTDFTAPLREYIVSGRPFLAICLGMQLLAEGSEESPGVAGLGVIRGAAVRLSTRGRVPQLGWNLVQSAETNSLVRSGWGYFANSYVLAAADDSWSMATARHGERFVAALARGPQLLCQFHPELSGQWGRELLQQWWARC